MATAADRDRHRRHPLLAAGVQPAHLRVPVCPRGPGHGTAVGLDQPHTRRCHRTAPERTDRDHQWRRHRQPGHPRQDAAGPRERNDGLPQCAGRTHRVALAGVLGGAGHGQRHPQGFGPAFGGGKLRCPGIPGPVLDGFQGGLVGGHRSRRGGAPAAARFSSTQGSFGGVAVGKPLAYLNSLMQLSFALNQGSMAEKFNIGSGPDWTVEITWGNYLD